MLSALMTYALRALQVYVSLFLSLTRDAIWYYIIETFLSWLLAYSSEKIARRKW